MTISARTSASGEPFEADTVSGAPITVHGYESPTVAQQHASRGTDTENADDAASTASSATPPKRMVWTRGRALLLAVVLGYVGIVLLLPLAALLGAALLDGSDIVARTIASPRELPVGIVTAVVGAPGFLYLLRSRT